MGAVAVTRDRRQNFGTQFVLFGTLTLSASYAAGGDSVGASDFGLTELDNLVLSIGPDTVAVGMRYVKTNAFGGLVKAFDVDDALQSTTAADLSGVVANYVAFGR